MPIKLNVTRQIITIAGAGKVTITKVNRVSADTLEVMYNDETEISQLDLWREKLGLAPEAPDAEVEAAVIAFEAEDDRQVKAQKKLEDELKQKKENEEKFAADLKRQLDIEGLSIDDLIKAAKAGKPK
jgi:hypothetical protein